MTADPDDADTEDADDAGTDDARTADADDADTDDAGDRTSGDRGRWHIVRAIARTEILRTVRGATGDQRGRAMAGVTALLLAAGLSVTLREAHGIGAAVEAGRVVGLLGHLRSGVSLLALLLVGLFALRTAARIARPTNVEMLATTVPSRQIVAGVLLAEYARNAALFAPLVALHALALGVGMDAPAIAVPATLATLLLLAVTLLLGYAIGVGVVVTGGRSSTDARALVLGLLAAVFLAAMVAGTADVQTPLAPYGDVFVAGSMLVPGLGRASLTVAGVLAASVPMLLAVALRVGPLAWYTSEGAGGQELRLLSAAPPIGDAGPTARVAWLQWVRAARSPVRLAHVVYLVLLLLPPAMVVSLFPSLAATVGGGLLAFAGAWFAGAVFCLNPVDDEGAALPVVLLSFHPPSTFVRARMAAGLVPGMAIVAAGVGLAATRAPTTGAALAVTGVASGLGGAGGGAALGFLAVRHADLGSGPRHEVPNPFVVVVYTVGSLLLTLAGAVGLASPDTIAGLLPVPTAVASLVGPVGVLAGLAVGALGYRYASGALGRHAIA